MKRKFNSYPLTLVMILFSAWEVQATGINVEMRDITEQGSGTRLGTVQITESKDGLVLTPYLKGLTPGEHGFHVHENGRCDAGEKDGKPVAGLKAGGHYDPDHSGQHQGPKGQGHRGDLPRLVVNADGRAEQPVQSGRLQLSELSKRSLMIHEGNDNYGDQPGGARVACGIIGGP